MACYEQYRSCGRHFAVAHAARFRTLLRHAERARQFLGSQVPVRRQHPDPRRRRLLLYGGHHRPRPAVYRGDGRGGQSVFPLCGLHRAPLSAARPSRIHRKIQGTFRCGLGFAAHTAFRADEAHGRPPCRRRAAFKRRTMLRLGRRDREGVAADAHGGLRRDGRTDGCRRGRDRRRPAPPRLARQHADRLPVG